MCELHHLGSIITITHIHTCVRGARQRVYGRCEGVESACGECAGIERGTHESQSGSPCLSCWQAVQPPQWSAKKEIDSKHVHELQKLCTWAR